MLTVNAVNDAPSFALSAAAVVWMRILVPRKPLTVVSSDDGDGWYEPIADL